jgi:hypothetical protein
MATYKTFYIFYFLMVGLSLIVFQVVDVEAQRGDLRGGDQQYDHRNDMNNGQQEGFRDSSFVEGDNNSGKCGKPVCPQ